jgi:hypothetical protein
LSRHLHRRTEGPQIKQCSVQWVAVQQALTCTEEKASVHIGQTLKCIEDITVHSSRNAREERWIFVEDMPVGVVVQRHDTQKIL